MEHRWGERIAVDIPVRIAGRAFSCLPGTLVNLSVSGAAIEGDFGFKPLVRIEVLLDLPHRLRSAAPSLHAYVARRGKDDIGIEWCEYSPEIVNCLLREATARRFSPLRRLDAHTSMVATIGSPPLLKRSQ
jgi:hypothetical protein